MAKAKVVGLQLFTQDIERLGDVSDKMVGEAIYQGAKIVADSLRAEMESIPTEKRWGTGDDMLSGLREEQKQGLLDSFGIAPARDENGVINVKMGFDGYNGIATKKYPGGQPNAMIARAVESGTSFRKRNPFITRAYRRAVASATSAMQAVFQQYFDKYLH